VLEVGLRIGAAFVGPRAIALVEAGREKIILCLGDSNTYGAYYDAADAYPGQLQALIDRRAPGRYRVLNLGLPGMNSSEIAARLPEWLDRWRPSAVVVSAGINNLWNRTDTDHAGGRTTWLTSLRLVRLYHLVAARIRGVPGGTGRPQVVRVLRDDGRAGQEIRDAATNALIDVHEGNLNEFDLDARRITAVLQRDLETILALTRARGVRLVLLTYAAFPLANRPRTIIFTHFEALNEAMRAFGREHDVPVVDVRDRFAALLAGTTARAEYFASEQESHPNPRGYAEIAALVDTTLAAGD
jgi:lysophospholipase L1-like esterase